MNYIAQYADYIKPNWAPPVFLFGPVWTFLYIIIAVSFGYVIYKYFRGEISFKTILPFLLNLVSNLIFTSLQFGLRSNIFASIDIVIVLVTLVWALFAIEKKYKWVMVVNLPYLAWVSYATALQLTITYLNR